MSHAPLRFALLIAAYLIARCASPALAASPAPHASGEIPHAGVWTANGLPVCTVSGEQTGPVVVPDGYGGALIAWVDARSGSETDLYASRILADGGLAPGWTEGGTPVCTESGDQYAVVAAGDGNGGVFLAWLDRRAGPGARLFLQHVDGGGSPTPGWPAGGTQALPDTAPSSVAIASDYAGGVLVAWLEEHSSPLGPIGAVRATRMTGAGVTAPGWPAEALHLSRPTSFGDYDPRIVPDRAGGAYVDWSDQWLRCQHDYCTPSGAIVLARILDGAIVWSTAYSEAAAPQGPYRALFSEDGVGGCYTGLARLFSARPCRVGPQDSPLWPYSCTSYGIGGFAQVFGDGAGGAVLAGRPQSGQGYDIAAIHLTPSGEVAPGWSPDAGNLICGATGDQILPQSAADGVGGIIFCWLDSRDAPGDLYASRWTVDGARAPGWVVDGNPVARGPGERLELKMVADGAGGAILAWRDTRGGSADIYAQRITETVPTAVAASLVRADATPDRVRLEWWLPWTEARVVIWRRDRAEDWRGLADALPDGTGRVIYEDHEVVRGSRYAYRLGILAGGEHRFSEEIWIDVPREVAFALSGARPNPSNGDFLVSLALDRSGPARLELLDSSGRQIEAKALPGPGLRFVRLDRAAGLPPGIYVLRLTQAGRTLTAKLGIVR